LRDAAKKELKTKQLGVVNAEEAAKRLQKQWLEVVDKIESYEETQVASDALTAQMSTLMDQLDLARLAEKEVGATLRKIEMGPVSDARMKSDGTFNNLAMKRAVEIAREEGYDKVAWATPEQQLTLYNPNSTTNSKGEIEFLELYENMYGKKIPSIAESLANKYGGKTGKTEIDQTAYDVNATNTIHDSITLTPEFKESIRSGQPLYEAGAIGALGSLLDSDFNEDTPTLLGTGAINVGNSLLDAMTRIDESNITERNAEVDIDSLNDEEFKAYVEYLYSKGLLNNY